MSSDTTSDAPSLSVARRLRGRNRDPVADAITGKLASAAPPAAPLPRSKSPAAERLAAELPTSMSAAAIPAAAKSPAACPPAVELSAADRPVAKVADTG